MYYSQSFVLSLFSLRISSQTTTTATFPFRAEWVNMLVLGRICVFHDNIFCVSFAWLDMALNLVFLYVWSMFLTVLWTETAIKNDFLLSLVASAFAFFAFQRIWQRHAPDDKTSLSPNDYGECADGDHVLVSFSHLRIIQNISPLPPLLPQCRFPLHPQTWYANYQRPTQQWFFGQVTPHTAQSHVTVNFSLATTLQPVEE